MSWVKELQKRYYDVIGELNKERAFDYPFKAESERRKKLKALYDRSKPAIEEELAQMIQLKKIKSSAHFDSARREHLLRLHNAGEFAFYAAFPKKGEIESTLQNTVHFFLDALKSKGLNVG